MSHLYDCDCDDCYTHKMEAAGHMGGSPPADGTYDDALIERAARALAGIEPDDDWPTNEALGGGLTGTRDDEYRGAMREQATEVLDAVADKLRAEAWDEGAQAWTYFIAANAPWEYTPHDDGSTTLRQVKFGELAAPTNPYREGA